MALFCNLFIERPSYILFCVYSVASAYTLFAVSVVSCAYIAGVYAFGFLFMLPQLYINYMVMKHMH